MTSRSVSRTLVTLAATALVLGTPFAARAQSSPTPAPGPAARVVQDQVVLSGTVSVPRGSTVGEVVVFHGRAVIEGAVDGDVVVLDGPIVIAGGYITGSVVALNGQIRITGAAQIGGDVLGAERVTVEPGAKVGGQVRQRVGFTLQGPLAALGVLLGAVSIAASILVLGLLLMLMAPRGAERVARAVVTAPFASFGWGFLVTIVVPVACVALMAAVAGLPLGLTALLALSFFLLLGLTWTAWAIGRAILRPPRARVPAFLAGWGIAAVIGFVPFLNLAFWGLGSMFGIGAMTVAAWRGRGTGSGRHRVGAAPEPAVVVPEVPAAPTPAVPATTGAAEPTYPSTADD